MGIIILFWVFGGMLLYGASYLCDHLLFSEYGAKGYEKSIGIWNELNTFHIIVAPITAMALVCWLSLVWYNIKYGYWGYQKAWFIINEVEVRNANDALTQTVYHEIPEWIKTIVRG